MILTVMFITYVYSGNSVICTRMTSSLGIGRVSTAIAVQHSDDSVHVETAYTDVGNHDLYEVL